MGWVVERPRKHIIYMEVEKATGKMKSGKTGGPMELVSKRSGTLCYKVVETWAEGTGVVLE